MLNPVSYKTYQPNFSANLNSPRLQYSAEDFFIKIKGYGKNKDWADVIVQTSDGAVQMIRKGRPFEHVLKRIADGVSEANLLTDDYSKRMKTGILRTYRMDWIGIDSEAYTRYKNNRYSVYEKRLDERAHKPLKKFDASIGMSRTDGKDILHGESVLINNALDYVYYLFNRVIPKFINGELTSENLDEVNETVAEMRWILAHATPWLRGSDAISNVFMRSIYKAIGVKTYPPKENISFDLEAYCTELEDYKKNFPNYFEKPPEVIEE